jgi:hypothetical protein
MFFPIVEFGSQPERTHYHHENDYITHKPAFSSLPPNNTLLQATIMSLKGNTKHSILCSHIVL